ncbi:ABC transporter permease [Roseivirga pacifica]|uniref:ABC transporter permease n=1 Tax=Roseivirga pacifica TaxID=1267423 RepID=UPI00209452BE|nr:ABC transporter permease [Roseivirga pacifica]MCO6359082.1 FtsX-like permease family protein [Roseivirga pacifica]MCO6365282.1 FtsX-like permease family protein [Roseivirga pacifica]MCO6371988.1 FtsX-like permease family protein [Roseivirga pacifica]MCO6375901.1 FtsX-like permease family protein [Roseivirga pacifica]MCO6379366.1 FtsX-like permease family protein [Roseivirga pacifica]
MFKTIIKTALRVFWKERAYAFLNILGLTVGLTASMLLLVYIDGERSVNQFHEKIDRMYQVMEHQNYSGTIFTTTANPGPLKDALKAEMPEVEHFAQFTWEQERLFKLDGQSFKESGRVASEDFFHVFSTKFIEGTKENSLAEPSVLYISESLKNRMFGERQALGASVTVNGWGEYKIGGVFEDIHKNTTLEFDFVMPYAPWGERNDWLEDWGNNGIRGLLTLNQGVDYKQFNEKIKGFVKEKNEGSVVELFVHPWKDVYLKGSFEDGQQAGGRITYVRLFTAVGIFILVIACINFMNLATARSTKRAKEVGVKKVVGSSKGQLILQFMGESVIMSTISALLAGLLIMLLMPSLNELIDKQLTFSFSDPNQMGTLLGLGLIVGLLAGSYPSLFLSNFKPVSVLKGSFRISGWSNGIRKGLVVFQFLISTFLIIATLIIHDQVNFVKNKNLGYQKENIVYLPIEGDLANEESAYLFMSRVLDNPNFSNVTVASNTPISIGSSTSGGYSWEGKAEDSETLFNVLQVGNDFIETLGMEILEGRAFDPSLKSDTMNVIINEQTAKAMNVENPLNYPVTFWGRSGKVIGIVKDFHFSSLHSSIDPIVISLRPESASYFIAKMSTNNTEEGIQYLESLTAEMNPNYPFNYRFLDESYENLYRSETTVGVLANAFSIIAIFISLLGLFGLASFAAEQRIKEIGIRKVLGAGIVNLIMIMSRGFIGLVGFGFIIAAPLAYWFMDDWLNDFEYRIQIGAFAFLLAGFASLIITIITVSFHSVRAARANPVKSLRYE